MLLSVTLEYLEWQTVNAFCCFKLLKGLFQNRYIQWIKAAMMNYRNPHMWLDQGTFRNEAGKWKILFSFYISKLLFLFQ